MAVRGLGAAALLLIAAVFGVALLLYEGSPAGGLIALLALGQAANYLSSRRR